MYLIVFFSSFLSMVLALFVQRNDKACLFVSSVYLLFLSLVFGFRYGVGKDYHNYQAYYLEKHNSFDFEYGYSLLNYFFYEAGLPFYAVTLVVALTCNYLILIGGWLFGLRGVYLHLSVIIYSSGFMLFSLNVMRQSLAVAVIFVFVAFLLRGWVWRFLIGCVLAMQFHVSAIAMSFLVFVRKFLASYLVLFSIIFISLFSFLGSIFYDFSKLFAGLALYVTGYEKYYNYVNNLESGSLGFGAALRAAFYAVLSLYFFFYRRNYNKKTVFIVSIMMLGVSFSSLSAVNFMWNRVGAYFIVFESLGAPFIIKGVKDRDLRAMFFVGAWGMAMIFMLFSLVLAGEESSLHYKNILFL